MSGSSGSAVAPMALTRMSQVSSPWEVRTRQRFQRSSQRLCSISQPKRMWGVTPRSSAVFRT